MKNNALIDKCLKIENEQIVLKNSINHTILKESFVRRSISHRQYNQFEEQKIELFKREIKKITTIDLLMIDDLSFRHQPINVIKQCFARLKEILGHFSSLSHSALYISFEDNKVFVNRFFPRNCWRWQKEIEKEKNIWNLIKNKNFQKIQFNQRSNSIHYICGLDEKLLQVYSVHKKKRKIYNEHRS